MLMVRLQFVKTQEHAHQDRKAYDIKYTHLAGQLC